MQSADRQPRLHGRPGQHHGTAVHQATGGRGQGVIGSRVVHRAIAKPHVRAPIPKSGQERAARVKHWPGHILQHGCERGAAGLCGDGRVQRRHQPVRPGRRSAKQRTSRNATRLRAQEKELETGIVQRHHQNTLALQVREYCRKCEMK